MYMITCYSILSIIVRIKDYFTDAPYREMMHQLPVVFNTIL